MATLARLHPDDLRELAKQIAVFMGANIPDAGVKDVPGVHAQANRLVREGQREDAAQLLKEYGKVYDQKRKLHNVS